MMHLWLRAWSALAFDLPFLIINMATRDLRMGPSGLEYKRRMQTHRSKWSMAVEKVEEMWSDEGEGVDRWDLE